MLMWHHCRCLGAQENKAVCVGHQSEVHKVRRWLKNVLYGLLLNTINPIHGDRGDSPEKPAQSVENRTWSGVCEENRDGPLRLKDPYGTHAGPRRTCQAFTWKDAVLYHAPIPNPCITEVVFGSGCAQ